MSLLRLFSLQGKVISALLMREIHTRYGRENVGYLWVIGEPLLFCIGVAIMWTAIRPAHEHGVPITAFVITGYVPLTIWRHCISRSVKAFEANGSLLFHRVVTPLDIIAARCILEVAGAVTAGAVVASGAMIVGYMDPPANLGLIYLGMFYEILFCCGCALIMAALTEMNEIAEKFVQILTYLAIPFSGSFSMVEWAPKSLQPVLLWSPSVHALEIIREGQFGAHVHPIYDLVYLSWSCALLMLVGLSLVLRSRKHIVVQ